MGRGEIFSPFILFRMTSKELFSSINVAQFQNGQLLKLSEGFIYNKNFDYKNVEAGSLNADDKIYISSSCALPRFKLRDYIEKKNISIKRDPAQANKIIIDKSLFEKLMTEERIKEYTLEQLQADIVRIQGLMTKVGNVNTDFNKTAALFDLSYNLRLLLQHLESNKLTEIVLLGIYDLRYTHQRILNHFDSSVFDKLALHSYDYKNIAMIVQEKCKADDKLDDYKKIQSLYANSIELINTDKILATLNNLVIGPDEFRRLSMMFESSDDANVVLAIESISNADPEKSIFPILTLLHKYGRIIESHRASSHINFRTLLKYFNINPGQLKYYISFGITSMPGILNTVKSKKLDTKANMDMFFQICEEEMRSQFANSFSNIPEITKHTINLKLEYNGIYEYAPAAESEEEEVPVIDESSTPVEVSIQEEDKDLFF